MLHHFVSLSLIKVCAVTWKMLVPVVLVMPVLSVQLLQLMAIQFVPVLKDGEDKTAQKILMNVKKVSHTSSFAEFFPHNSLFLHSISFSLIFLSLTLSICLLSFSLVALSLSLHSFSLCLFLLLLSQVYCYPLLLSAFYLFINSFPL